MIRAAAHTHPLLPIALALWLAACGGDDPAGPYVEFLGGGFIFNYRLAEADYGFVVKPLRTLPAGTVLEALFEDPAGGPPLRVRQTARSGMLQYSFRSPPVTGVVAGRPYRVELRLLEAATGTELARYERSFHADIGQEVLPAAPPVVGPGYQPNPAAVR